MKILTWLFCLLSIQNLIAQIKFKNSTAALLPEKHFSGSVVGISDLNGDGLDDILRLGLSVDLSTAYQSSPGNAFSIKSFGKVSPYQVWNNSIADINHDGLNDFIISANENLAFVYYARKIGNNIDYSIQSLDSSGVAYAQAGNLVDINNDGWLDYFLCNDLKSNLIWANNRAGLINGNPVKWIDFSTKPASDNSGNYGSTWNDFDNDGDLDLYIAKCKAGASSPTDPRRINTYYRNNGNGSFTEIAAQIGLASGAQSWVAVSGDSDNDGDLDIFVLNHFLPSELLINDGTGKFTNEYSKSNISFNAIGVQAAWVDLDNDGWQDLIISGSQHHIYKNKGKNQFELIDSKELGLFQIESFALGDLNNDGWQDIYCSYSQLFNQASHRADAVFLNSPASSNHFIKIRLEGTKSNRSAIGARISLYANGVRQMREIQSGHSYGVHHSLIQHFGIGLANKIDSVIIRWPSGIREKIESPFIDKTMVIRENQCFAFDPILSSLPNKNVICTPADSFKISVPLAGNYLWTTGATTKEILVKSPGDYHVKLVNTDGCTLYSNRLGIISDPKSRYRIGFTDTVICAQNATTLAITSPYKLKWNTGDTNKIIKTDKEGFYFANTENECGSSMSDTVYVRKINSLVTKVINDTVVLSAKATLKAEGNSLSWFSEAIGGSLLTTGNAYQTNPINKSTTYYVQSIIVNKGISFTGGLKKFSGTSKLHANSISGGLFFDANSDFILKSVKVYTDTAGTREINLVLPNGTIYHSKLIRIEKGESVIDLNFYIPAGLGYKLTTNEDAAIKVFGFKSPLLYRDSESVEYPLTSGPLVIYGSTGGTNYYYFYDWQLSYPDLECKSDRIPVSAVVRTISSKDEYYASKWNVYPNPVVELLSVSTDKLFKIGNIDFEIMDLMGRNVIKGILKNSEINVSGLKSGLYTLVLKQKGIRTSKKFLKLE